MKGKRKKKPKGKGINWKRGWPLLLAFGAGLLAGGGLIALLEHAWAPPPLPSETEKIESTDVKQLLSQAVEAFHLKNDPRKTLRLFQKILTIDPNNYDANLYCGTLYAQQIDPPDFGAAIYHTNRALKVKKDYIILMAYGGLLWQDQDWAEAETVFRDCVNEKPGDYYAWWSLAFMLEQEGKYAEALADYTQSETLTKDAAVVARIEAQRMSLMKKMGAVKKLKGERG